MFTSIPITPYIRDIFGGKLDVKERLTPRNAAFDPPVETIRVVRDARSAVLKVVKAFDWNFMDGFEEAYKLRAEAGADLDPFCVSALEQGRVNIALATGIPYALCDWAEGNPLEPGLHFIQRELRTDLLTGFHFAQGTLECLEALHKAGLVHRDIKPNNVVFQDGKARLIDLDFLAKDGTEMKIGLSHAMAAPENRSGWWVTPKSDIWSVGASTMEYFERGAKLAIQSHGADAIPMIQDNVRCYPESVHSLIPGMVRLILESKQRHPNARPTAKEALQILTERTTV